LALPLLFPFFFASFFLPFFFPFFLPLGELPLAGEELPVCLEWPPLFLGNPSSLSAAKVPKS
jgi:hypothetical protein